MASYPYCICRRYPISFERCVYDVTKRRGFEFVELPMRLPGYKSGYAPAPLYSLGLSGSFNPSESHAAMLQRLHESLPSKFNTTIISSWLEMTGNPPLIHIP